jgi:pyruvyltransferase
MTLLSDAARRASAVNRSVALRLRLLTGAPVVYWWRKRPNFGDALNPLLVQAVSRRYPIHSKEVPRGYRGPVYAAIGSVLGGINIPNLVVWGSGFISDTAAFRLAPAQVCAVRGPLSQERFSALGVRCPSVYGDPALLYPRLFPSSVTPVHDFGIIPHYADAHSDVVQQLTREGAFFIDVEADVHRCVRDIRSCRVIASSSLHGLIVALAFGIPAVWVEFSDRVIGSGFKFRDFYASINAPAPSAVPLTSPTAIPELIGRAVATPIDLDLDRLLAACPFAR